MTKIKPKKRVVRVQNKGMITIPIIFRKKLKIEEDTLLELHLDEDHLILKPYMPKRTHKGIKLYSEKEIQKMIERDILHPKIAKKLKSLLE